jgi:two-component system sensor histidine kinase/response regulator
MRHGLRNRGPAPIRTAHWKVRAGASWQTFATSKSRAVPTQGPATAEVAEADELPEVPGLNTADGLMRVAGNKKPYLKLLRQFSTTEAVAQRIASALVENDRARAERMAHTVKGVAGNIGATAVQNAAATLEKAIAGSAPAAEIEVWRVSLEESLAHLIHGLKAALKGQKANRRRQAIQNR